ncbi:hypothetical protein CY34DRAFT_17919 [Suillus luteus UH-Slu-Lm8-n1]|uniref:Uncharacterized protein n=1 Tax=Suillus luteus UH-Slu-Lm8-n1 TaxID=930992 RepID=A0A0D0A7M5_9AGAM|nr:hypothetical protein CY34DRAFT_17919 [Suillus luteus UH-Slu-Lm8-n1]
MEVSGCSAIAVTRQWSMQYLSPHPLTLPPKSTSTNCPLPHYITPNLVHPSSLQLPSHPAGFTSFYQPALREVNWWGDFIPIERWNPPRVAHRFPEWGHKRYNMSPEVWIDTMNDHGDSTPDKYDRAYLGRDEYIEELSAMFNEDWARSQCPEIICSPMTESTDDEMVDQLDPSYDLGWNTHPSGSETPPAWGDESHSPAYDLGWGSQAPEAATPSVPAAVPETSVDDDPVYDLGWGHASSVDALAPAAQPDEEFSAHEDDGPAFDLGWDAQVTAPEVGMESGELGDASDDGPAYDLGWGNEHPEEEPMDNDNDDYDNNVVVVKSEAKEDILHDVTGEGSSTQLRVQLI